ncbi:hypothetical protein OVA26_16780 [Microbacterium sp. SL62]|uniref:hypothetical protein n=1 Tax=Microbacterium sp. SL62 TaxID=2995139 RepID=UPI00227344CB|nr:hypothetical protein [Microbacterium sp. SL62]MCY1718594.1 hypothetical protein [Microbacterium sp. SL62]
MKKLTKIVVTAGLGVGLLMSGAQAASAATFYDDINYGKYLETLSSGNLTYSDKASSIRNTGWATYCENNGCAGRTVRLNGSYNDLRAVNSSLNFGETWSDRISAVKP